MDPQKDSNGNPYGPTRYKQIVKECYIISKNINTSYTDLLNITPIERGYLIEFLVEDAKRRKEEMDKARAEREAKKNSR